MSTSTKRAPAGNHLSLPGLPAPARPEVIRGQVDNEPDCSRTGRLLEGSAQKRTLVWRFRTELAGNGKIGRWRERRARDG
jgi:hypothetical protein